MDVVGHDDKFVKQKFSLVAIVGKGVDHQLGSGVVAEDWKTSCSDGGNKENAIRIHAAMLQPRERFCR